MIYDKRRALIEYVVFYSSVTRNTAPENRLDVTELQREHRDQTLMGEEFTNHERRISEHDADDSHSRSSSPVSGNSSPPSGRSTPNSDGGTDDVQPVTYESVKCVSVVRQRTKPAPTQSGLCINKFINGASCVCVHV